MSGKLYQVQNGQKVDVTPMIAALTDVTSKADVTLGNLTPAGNEALAHAAAPSGQYIELPIPTAPNVYYTTVPSDGFVIARATATGSADGALFALAMNEDGYATTHVCIPNKAWGMSACLAVRKGSSIKINYVNATVRLVRFYYANGSAPTNS